MNLKVCEIFTSMQGEGPRVGEITYFLRLAGCDLNCPFCDTKYSWGDGREMNIMSIAKEFQSSPARTACITGGEPLLQIEGVCSLSQFIPQVTMETNGLHLDVLGGKRWRYIEDYVISPKFTVRSMEDFLSPWQKITKVDARELLARSCFKFVVDLSSEIKGQIQDSLKFVKEIISIASYYGEFSRLPVRCYFQPMDELKVNSVDWHQESHRKLWDVIVKMNDFSGISLFVLPQLHKMLCFK